MSNVINMDEKTRIARILAERGEDAARGDRSAVYPPLQAPDPTAGRFRKLYFGDFEMKSISWVGVDGEMPDYSPEKGWSNLGPAVELHIGGRVPKNIPDIIRVTHGLCCSKTAADAMRAMDPEGVDVVEIKLVADGGARVEPYALVGLTRRMDIINWAQSGVGLKYIESVKEWAASPKGKYAVRTDVDPSIHIVQCRGQMLSIELIEALRDSGAKGVYFVNEADFKTSYKF